MGYRLEAVHANLDFADTPLHGAHVKTRLDVKLDTVLNLQTLTESGKASDIREAFRQFGSEVLIEWDLETEKGVPIPIGEKGMLELDMLSAQYIMQAWMSAIAQVSDPLAQRLRDGSNSPERSTVPANLSSSLESLSTRN